MVQGCTAREDFWIPPPQPAPASQRCAQSRSGSPAIDFRVSFAKEVLLRMIRGDIDILEIFGSHPHSRLQAQKCVPRLDLEAQLLTSEHILLKRYCYE